MVCRTRVGLGDRSSFQSSLQHGQCDFRQTIYLLHVWKHAKGARIDTGIANPRALQHTRSAFQCRCCCQSFSEACKVKGLVMLQDDKFEHCLAWRSVYLFLPS